MIVLLTGNNSFLRLRQLRQLKDDFVRQSDPLGIEQLDGKEADLTSLLEAPVSLPFLVPSKMVILDQPSSCPGFSDKFEDLITKIPDSVTLVIVEPKLNRSSKYYKLLKKHADIRQFDDLPESSLVSFLIDEAKAYGSQIDRTSANYLIKQVGTDQALLAQEISKLSLTSQSITTKQIDQQVEPRPQSQVFDLLAAAFSGNKSRALELYEEQRQQKIVPPEIIGLMAWQLHLIALVKFSGGKSVAEIAKDSGLSTFVLNKARDLAGRWKESELKQQIRQLADYDKQLKSTKMDADQALRYFILNI